MNVLEEVESKPVAEGAGFGDGFAVLGPGGVERGGSGVAEAVAEVGGVEGGVEEEDAVREGGGEVGGGRIEDALVGRAEAAEGDTEGEAEVIGEGLWIELLGVVGERGVLGAVDGGLGPFLGVAPWRGDWAAEFYGGLAVGFGAVKGT